MTTAEKQKKADFMALYDSLNEINKIKLEERALILLGQQTANRHTVVDFRTTPKKEKGTF